MSGPGLIAKAAVLSILGLCGTALADVAAPMNTEEEALTRAFDEMRKASQGMKAKAEALKAEKTSQPRTEDAGNLLIRCKAGSKEECQSRTDLALKAIGCKSTTASSCQPSAEDPGAIYCSVSTENCEEPHADMISTTTCFFGSKVSLSKVDPALTLSWTMGFFRTYVKDICRE